MRMDPLQVTSGLCGQRVIYSHIIQMRLFYRTNAVCTTRNPSFLLVVVVRLSNRFNNPIVLLERNRHIFFLATIRLHSAIPFFCFAFVSPISLSSSISRISGLPFQIQIVVFSSLCLLISLGTPGLG